MVLLPGLDVIQPGDGLHQQVGAQSGQAHRQSRRILVRADLGLALGKDRTVVQLVVHAHDRDAGDAVSGQDCLLDGRSATVTRQQGGVHVNGATSRQLKNLARNDLAIGNDDQQVRG